MNLDQIIFQANAFLASMNRCIACEQFKPLSEFYFGEGRRRDRYSSKCRQCKHIERMHSYRSLHKTIRRRDLNGRGYTRDNVAIISWRANVMKQHATPDELMRLAIWAKKSEVML